MPAGARPLKQRDLSKASDKAGLHSLQGSPSMSLVNKAQMKLVCEEGDGRWLHALPSEALNDRIESDLFTTPPTPPSKHHSTQERPCYLSKKHNACKSPLLKRTRFSSLSVTEILWPAIHMLALVYTCAQNSQSFIFRKQHACKFLVKEQAHCF